MRISDWSSDVCSSDLQVDAQRSVAAPVIARVIVVAARYIPGLDHATLRSLGVIAGIGARRINPGSGTAIVAVDITGLDPGIAPDLAGALLACRGKAGVVGGWPGDCTRSEPPSGGK